MNVEIKLPSFVRRDTVNFERHNFSSRVYTVTFSVPLDLGDFLIFTELADEQKLNNTCLLALSARHIHQSHRFRKIT